MGKNGMDFDQQYLNSTNSNSMGWGEHLNNVQDFSQH